MCHLSQALSIGGAAGRPSVARPEVVLDNRAKLQNNPALDGEVALRLMVLVAAR